ncbi:hypothetical protein KOW79_006744 [Hemibagrus wyckioides]|uniref:USP domain-containing protein n=1 Tax=Hemibagrus wyckioides TaxID=337641 RepID=A0A9D3NXY7_9TELE|nr:hypothetical protein KOW79_006744 [Hemibagrus wyckioides]
MGSGVTEDSGVTSSICDIFRKKSKTSASSSVKTSESTISSTTATETSKSSEESTKKKRKKKQGGARKVSRWHFWRKKNKVHPVAFTESTSTTSTETQSNEESTKKKQGGARKTFEWRFWRFWRKKNKEHYTGFSESSETPREIPQIPTSSLQMKDFVVDSDEEKESVQEGQTAEKMQEVNETIVLLDNELKKFVISLHLEHHEKETKPNRYRPEGPTKSMTPAPAEEHLTVTVAVAEKQMLFGGLPNFENNCYINASLQCLFRAESFCQELSTLLEDYTDRPEAWFLSCFVNLWKLRNTSDAGLNKDILLLSLINVISAINPKFTIHKPNDARVFLNQFLFEMEKCGRKLGWQNDVDPRCPVRSNFKFKIRDIITCSSCGNQTENKLKGSYYLSVPLVHSTVDLCLDKAVNNQEVFEAECSVCGGQFASFSRTIETLPKAKKTKDCRQVKERKPIFLNPKLHINNPEQSSTLDQTKQSSVSQSSLSQSIPEHENSRAEARETGSEKSLESERQRDTVMDNGGSISMYQLISVLSHVGTSTEYGHFVSDCSSHRPHQWITYNDLDVTQTTEEDVLKKRSSDAYVLLYERVSTG